MKLAEIVIRTDGGPWVEHNMPCPIYGDEPAVYCMDTGIFMPSRAAQRDGYAVVKSNSRFGRWVLRTFFSV